MEVNRETAMRLWTTRYGKKVKVTDFAGRVMVKSAYDDRKSEFGWNLDHIYPQSKGGKTADHNLICCHILTNDEKADKTSFTANGQQFNVVKFQNHYEIINVSNPNTNEKKDPTLYDSAYGVRRYKQFRKEAKQQKFCAEIVVDLRLLESYALFDFIQDIFDTENVTIVRKDPRTTFLLNYYSPYRNERASYMVVIKDYDVHYKNLIENLLDKCILLNTYLNSYFQPLDVVAGFDIFFRVVASETADDYLRTVDEGVVNRFSNIYQAKDSMWINDLVISNTKAEDDLTKEENNGSVDSLLCGSDRYYEYNYVWTQLSKNLKKEVSRQK